MFYFLNLMNVKIDKEIVKKMLILTIVFGISSIFIITPLIDMFQNLKGYRGQGTLSTGNMMAMYKNPMLTLAFLAQNPGKILTLLKIDIFLIVITVILVSIMKNLYGNDTQGIKYKEKDGTHGTAKWMKDNEIESTVTIGSNTQPILNLNKKDSGISYGVLPQTTKNVKLPLDSFVYNKNVAIFGGPGSGKSRTYVRNNVFELVEARQSIIFTDPKGELFRDLFIYLKEQNYNVKVLNLVNLLNSDGWNPLLEVKDDISAQMFTEVVIANTTPPGSKGGDFWEKGEQNLLKALILYVVNEFAEEDISLKNLYGLISHTEAQQLDSMFKRLPSTHPAKAPYNIFCQASETVRTGIIIGLGTRLQIIQNRKVQELTSTNDIDLSAPGKEPCAYFCITSDTNSTFDFLSGLFFSFLFINLINYADLHDGKCEPNVHCLLDEFPNIAAIPDFTKKISTMRSRGVHTHVIFQNIGQLQNRYPNNGWSEILGSCDSKLFLGCTDLLTAQYVSDVLGTATVEDLSRSKKAGLDGVFDMGNQTQKGTKRNLLNPDEVLAFSNENSILMLKGQKPLKLQKQDYTFYKESKMLKVIQISDYVADWAKVFIEESNKEKASRENIKKKEEDKEKENISKEVQQNKEKEKENNKERKNGKKTTPKKKNSQETVGENLSFKDLFY